MQTTSDTIYYARHVALKSGVPQEVPALTVNRLCGSGFQAVVSGAQEILLDEAEICLVGGGESMSQAPHIARGMRWGLSARQESRARGLAVGRAQGSVRRAARWATPRRKSARSSASTGCAPMSSRCARRCSRAMRGRAGIYEDEVVGVPVRNPKTKKEEIFARDEHMRPDTSAEGLAKLRTVFKESGLVTAGNASGIGDGGAALVISSAEYAKRTGKKPLARLVSWGTAGVDPKIMGIGPVPASNIALKKAGMTLDQIDLVEVNEAFASQVCAVERALGIDRNRLNIHGGAIALSHPLAASGARICRASAPRAEGARASATASAPPALAAVRGSR